MGMASRLRNHKYPGCTNDIVQKYKFNTTQ